VSYNEKYLWSDPVPDAMRAGVLLADQIRFFVDAVHLISPGSFSEEDLRPAAYDLHIGDTYYVDDEAKTLGPKQWFRIPANGLVYVKTKESFNVPYYMVARYSLRVTQVYRGLLIDNGLHIDPGYHGPIYIPVHNFADQDRTLSEGQAFLSVEFARTTPLPALPLARIATEAELVCTHGRPGLGGHAGYKVILFNKDPEDLKREPRTPPDFWNRSPFAGEEHKSAMIGRLANLRDELTSHLSRLRNVGLLGLLAIVVALFAAVFPWISGRYLDTERAYTESALKVQMLSEEVRDLKKEVETRPLGSLGPVQAAPKQQR
jgi:deoxycytidine triphosphate deaminase